MKGWKKKLLFQAGREVLIKAVIQAIPTYTMSCFKLPKCLVQDIESHIRKFWWGYMESNERSIGLVGRSFANQKRKGVWVSES